MDKGEIYKVTCPEGKIYIGKCVQYLKSGEKYGTNGRWTGHLSDSRRSNGGSCRRLNEAIRRHNETGFSVEVIRIVDESELGELERYNYDQGGNPIHGHGREFREIFKFLLEESMKIGVYKYENYSATPKEYCGIMINSTIL